MVKVSGFSGGTDRVGQQGVPSPLTRKPRRVGYVRTSDDSQKTALQLDAMKTAKCDVLFRDRGVSGKSGKRRGLWRALRTLQEGDTLVVWKIDRLGRIDTELLQMRDEFLRRRITLISITQGIDTSTPIGRLAYGQLALFAAFELEQLSERTKAGMSAAKARGVHVGRVSNTRLRQAHGNLSEEGCEMEDVARKFGVSERALQSGFARLGLLN